MSNRNEAVRRPSIELEAAVRPPDGPRRRSRGRIVLLGFVGGAMVLLGRAIDLQTGQRTFLKSEAAARHVRTVSTPAPRGIIRDRRGTPLAMSTTIESSWADPGEVEASRERWPELAEALEVDRDKMVRRLAENRGKSFLYLRRHVDPALAERVRTLEIPGVYFSRELRRYYPSAEIAAHVVGFADIDGSGREGIEFVHDSLLRGIDGKKQIIQDRLGRGVEDVQNVRSAQSGRDVHLTIDLRLQSLAYRALKATVLHHRADGGSVVVIGARTGEILAMVNQPSYNPNDTSQRQGGGTRNRALTDLFEPGSTVKPFAIAAGLEAGTIGPDSVVSTSPGYLRVGGHTIRDRRDLGDLDVTSILTKSSNVGVGRVALDTPPDTLWEVFSGAGFGVPPGTGFVGESAGVLKRSARFGELERTTLSFGYGLAVAPAQLARAYTIFANEGALLDLKLARVSGGAPRRSGSRRVISKNTARTVLEMLEHVVEGEGGTGRRARVPGYRVAGKTGTSRKAIPGGYARNRYMSVFVGLAPVSDPRFIAAVVIDEPRGKDYYGGLVAAPVFRSIVADALRLDAVPPDSHRTPRREAATENYAQIGGLAW